MSKVWYWINVVFGRWFPLVIQKAAFSFVQRSRLIRCEMSVERTTLAGVDTTRLIPLDKKPGVRPIGVGEVLRRIIGRCIARCVSADLKHLGSNIQLCLGQKCGIEHAVHTLREEFDADESCSILLIDASNAFNLLNRKLALDNIETICPSLVTALRNSYSETSHLFVKSAKLKSEERVTQGDPL